MGLFPPSERGSEPSIFPYVHILHPSPFASGVDRLHRLSERAGWFQRHIGVRGLTFPFRRGNPSFQKLGGGKHSLFSPLPGEMIQFD